MTLRQHLEPFLTTLYPDQHVEVEQISAPTAGLTVVIKVAQNPDVATLLARLEACQQPIVLTGTRE